MSTQVIGRDVYQTTFDGPAAEPLRRVLERAERPRALLVRPDQQAVLRRAVDRAAAQLHAESDCVLTIALAGGSGVGKSTLINALAGATIAEAAEQRPCTMQPTIYHHREVPGGGLPVEIIAQARDIAHDRPELRFKVVVDTPDLDTFATQNRAATKALLKAAGLVIYVFTPEKYWDERVWSVIRDEQRFSGCLAVLNKADLVPPAALERAAEEIRRRFGEMGKPDIGVLRVCAARHVPRADGSLPVSDEPVVDEFPTLRAYIENELREGDIARMRREQRVRVVEHLAREIERVIPENLSQALEGLSTRAGVLADEHTDRLTVAFADRLQAVEAEVGPLVAIRRHQAFWGPFRVWLALSDLFSYGIPRLVRRLRAIGGGPCLDIAALLGTGPIDRLDEAVVNAGARLRDAAFSSGLPVERWRAITDASGGSQLLSDLGKEIQTRFDEAASARSLRLRVVAQVASFVGLVIPLGLAAYALVALTMRLQSGQIMGGFDMLTLVLALTVLAYALLHGLVNLALLGLRPQSIQNAGRQSIHAVLQRTFGGWVAGYRADLDADAADLRAPVAALKALALGPIEGTFATATPRISKPEPVVRPSWKVSRPEPSRVAPEMKAPEEARGAMAETPLDAARAEPTVSAEPRVAAEESAREDHKPQGTAAVAGESEPDSVPVLRPAEIFRQAVQRHASAAQSQPPKP